MNWFFITLLAPFLYALTNHIDKLLLEKYFKEGGVGTLMLFSSLLSALALPFLYLADPMALSVSFLHIFVLALVGIINILVLWFYFLALRDAEASVVIVFYQLVPVFGLVLAYIILGEVITQMQSIAMVVILFGTTIISFEIDESQKFKFRKKTVIYMMLASFFWALGSVVFKAVAIEENVWRSLFWEHLMLTIIGLFLFVFVKSYRANFLIAIKHNSKAILTLNLANELLFMLGNLIFSFSYLLAPVSLILLMNSFQPIFVLIIGVLLTVLLPKATFERIQIVHIWQKLVAIAITGGGTYLLLDVSDKVS